MNLIIEGEIVPKKNNLCIRRAGGRSFIAPNDFYNTYKESALWQLSNEEKWQGDYPVILEIFVYRKTVRRFDFDNIFNTIQDILVGAGILEDDNMKMLIPKVKGLGWAKDKDNPRVEVFIRSYKDALL